MDVRVYYRSPLVSRRTIASKLHRVDVADVDDISTAIGLVQDDLEESKAKYSKPLLAVIQGGKA